MCKSGLIVKLHQPLQQGSCHTSHTFQKIIGLGPGHILMVLSERIVEQLRDSGHGENRQFINLESTVLRKLYALSSEVQFINRSSIMVSYTGRINSVLHINDLIAHVFSSLNFYSLTSRGLETHCLQISRLSLPLRRTGRGDVKGRLQDSGNLHTGHTHRGGLPGKIQGLSQTRNQDTEPGCLIISSRRIIGINNDLPFLHRLFGQVCRKGQRTSNILQARDVGFPFGFRQRGCLQVIRLWVQFRDALDFANLFIARSRAGASRGLSRIKEFHARGAKLDSSHKNSTS
nr:MAG TPA: hypothetical protein [Caudoviricetes sp.]